MHRNIKNVINCVITLVITIILVVCTSSLLERKDSKVKYEDFFKQEEPFDVLFFGASHMVNGVFPMELWDKYGIVSYNFGGHANQIATSYWVMKNALDYTKPKLVVIDCLNVERDYKCDGIFSYVHLSLDAFPLSWTKLKTAWDLTDDPKLRTAIEEGITQGTDESRTKIELLMNYSLYHSRWNQLEEKDFNIPKNYEKGAESRIAVTQGYFNKINDELKIEPGTIGDIYLKKMIEDCKKEQIEVLLIYLPFPASEIQQKTANYIEDVAEEYDVHYINFLKENIVDYNTDLYDRNSHLNPSGARKVTNYLGKYIQTHYNIEDQRNNENYNFWNVDYAEYTEMKDENIRNCSDLLSYLMLLYEDKLEFEIKIYNEELITDDRISALLANLGVDIASKLMSNRMSDERFHDIEISVSRQGELVDRVYFSKVIGEIGQANEIKYEAVRNR